MGIIRKQILRLSAITVYYVFEIYMIAAGAVLAASDYLLLMYISILVINIVGVYVYDYFKEDVFFMDFANNYIQSSNGLISRFLRDKCKTHPKASSIVTFVALSTFPCPLTGYLFLKGAGNRSFCNTAVIIAIGAIPCTIVWAGGIATFFKKPITGSFLVVVFLICWMALSLKRSQKKEQPECKN
jgi:hypothetical protein